MERELIRTEKLTIAGEMAAGLAHEIRNPLAIIRGFIQLYREGKEGRKRNNYEIIINEIDRVNHFINDLLNIANPKLEEKLENTNLVNVLENILTLQTSQINKKGITINKQLGEIPTIYIDPNEVQQVLINIIQNAIEAMDSGGTLTIQTKHLATEDKLTVEIKDTGIGMEENTLKKLGTPFYTTKKTGTGLGLTMSFRLIEEMKGTVCVSSKRTKGSKFTITLPVVKDTKTETTIRPLA